MLSTTSSVAAGCRRGFIARSAKSAAWLIRSTNRSVDGAFGAVHRQHGTRADRAGETIDAIDKEVSRMPRTAPPRRNSTTPSPIWNDCRAGARHVLELAQAPLQYQTDKLPIDYIQKSNSVVDAVTLDDAKAGRETPLGTGAADGGCGTRPAGRSTTGRGPAQQDELTARRKIARLPLHRARSHFGYETIAEKILPRYVRVSRTGGWGPGDAMLRISRDLVDRRARHRDRFRPRLRPGRPERQQALDLRPIALRHPPA